MTIGDLKLVGGTGSYKHLTNKLTEKEYAVHKAYAWMALLKQGERPVKWNRPTNRGTTFNFAVIQDRMEFETAYGEFKGYIAGLNAKYPELKMELVENDS